MRAQFRNIPSAKTYFSKNEDRYIQTITEYTAALIVSNRIPDAITYLNQYVKKLFLTPLQLALQSLIQKILKVLESMTIRTNLTLETSFFIPRLRLEEPYQSYLDSKGTLDVYIDPAMKTILDAILFRNA
jgi:hypothetical protein